MPKPNNDQNSPSGAESAQATCSASLVERQAQKPKYEMPTWGTSITTGELITLMLQREGTRDEALEVLAQTLADLGISGEELAHWQKKPGICRDCAETDDRVHRGYAKSDVQNAQDLARKPGTENSPS